MRSRNLLLIVSLLFPLATVSANGDSRQQTETNPIVVESQIESVAIDGDAVVIRLVRQPYDIVARKWQRVVSRTNRGMYAVDLQVRDVVRIDGDLDAEARDPYDLQHRGVVYVSRIVLQSREEHRP